VEHRFVEVAIQGLVLHEPNVHAWQIIYGALLKPQPVLAPFTAVIEQAMYRQHLQAVLSAGVFATVRQTYVPQTIASCAFAQVTGEPTGILLPRSMSLHRIVPSQKARLLGACGQLTVSVKYGRLGAPLGIFIERHDSPTPPLPPAVVDCG